jgi:hypothetical protein
MIVLPIYSKLVMKWLKNQFLTGVESAELQNKLMKLGFCPSEISVGERMIQRSQYKRLHMIRVHPFSMSIASLTLRIKYNSDTVIST